MLSRFEFLGIIIMGDGVIIMLWLPQANLIVMDNPSVKRSTDFVFPLCMEIEMLPQVFVCLPCGSASAECLIMMRLSA